MIKKQICVILLLPLMVISCYKLKNPKKPDNLISEDKMVNILIDIRLMSSATGTNKRTLDNHISDKEDYIYNKYDIDSLQFAESNAYYTYHIDTYDDIYAKVKDSLSVLKSYYQELEVKELEQKKEKDSLEALLKKDTLGVKKGKDLIDAIKINDSLTKKLDLNGNDLDSQKGLIAPVSDTVGQ